MSTSRLARDQRDSELALSGGSGSPGSQRPRWLAAARLFVNRRHRVLVEAAMLVLVYEIYNLSRGLVSAGRAVAVAHAHELVTLERWLRVDFERSVQRAVERVPGLVDVFDFEYATLHLIAAVAVLIWLYRKNTIDYVRYRFALVLSCLGAVAVFTAWPAAPPRMAGIAIADSLARSGVNPDSRTLTIFYNPYAAFPSLHEAFAVVVGFYLVHATRTRIMRLVGVVYPLWIAIEVMATGNHFIVDVVAGGFLALAALWAAYRACPDQPAIPTSTAARIGGKSPRPHTPRPGGGGSWAPSQPASRSDDLDGASRD